MIHFELNLLAQDSIDPSISFSLAFLSIFCFAPLCDEIRLKMILFITIAPRALTRCVCVCLCLTFGCQFLFDIPTERPTRKQEKKKPFNSWKKLSAFKQTAHPIYCIVVWSTAFFFSNSFVLLFSGIYSHCQATIQILSESLE